MSCHRLGSEEFKCYTNEWAKRIWGSSIYYSICPTHTFFKSIDGFFMTYDDDHVSTLYSQHDMMMMQDLGIDVIHEPVNIYELISSFQSNHILSLWEDILLFLIIWGLDRTCRDLYSFFLKLKKQPDNVIPRITHSSKNEIKDN